MTAITRTPTNTNLLHPNKFLLSFQRAPNLQFFCQSVVVPGLSLGEVPRNSPFVDLYSPGEKAIYDLLNITFLVDEELKSWLEIHDWIRALTFPTEFTEFENLKNMNQAYAYRSNLPQYSDATLTILSSSNTPYYRFTFKDLFPLSLTSFSMSAADTPDNIITADAAFRFAYYNVEKLF